MGGVHIVIFGTPAPQKGRIFYLVCTMV